MTTQVQSRRGTAAQIASFTGAQGELVVDTDNSRVVVQDGATAGGFSAAKLSEVVTSVAGRRGAVTLSYSDLVSGYPGPHVALITPGNKTSTAINSGGSLANLRMLGFGQTFTPTKSGVCFIGLWCQVSGSVIQAGDFALCYGTGTPPVNGAAQTGTSATGGASQVWEDFAANDILTASLFGVVVLTVGTTYWLDCAMGSRNSSAVTTTMFNPAITIIEF